MINFEPVGNEILSQCADVLLCKCENDLAMLAILFANYHINILSYLYYGICFAANFVLLKKNQ
jgi:hypothetical protein